MDRKVSLTPTLTASDSSAELQKRLTGYGMTALAITGAVAAGAGSAQASVVIFTPTPLTASLNGPSVLFDFATGTSDFSGGSIVDPQFRLRARGLFTNSTQTITGTGGPEVHTFHYSARAASIRPLSFNAYVASTTQFAPFGTAYVAVKVPFAQEINSTNFFFTSSVAGLAGQRRLIVDGGTYYNSLVGQFVPGAATANEGIIGLQFQLVDGMHFGWADVTVNPDYSVTLNRFGYETEVNTGILAPNVAPEASPLTLLLVGGPIALATYRKLRRRDEPETLN